MAAIVEVDLRIPRRYGRKLTLGFGGLMSEESTRAEEHDDLQRVINYYRRKILTGQIKDGERLPSPEEMEERHGISHAQASRVYEELYARGLAVKRP
jgi:DNA-binding FadR family transcriptional regulator